MGGITTLSVVTAMKNAHVAYNLCSSGQEVGQFVSFNATFGFVESVVEVTVAATVGALQASGPWPAFIWAALVYVKPESLYDF
jgi:hypothetical protein